MTETPWLAEFERPEVLWWPSIAPSGLTFYTGEHFPAWRGNLFVGSMMVGRMQRTGHLERIVFNRRGEEVRREWLLTELKQRIRDVRQGPDGYLYVLTEEDDAVLLRIEPAHAITDPPGTNLLVDRLTEPRVPPLPETEWTDEQRALVDMRPTAILATRCGRSFGCRRWPTGCFRSCATSHANRRCRRVIARS